MMLRVEAELMGGRWPCRVDAGCVVLASGPPADGLTLLVLHTADQTCDARMLADRLRCWGYGTVKLQSEDDER
jgi:hypothetical protein